MITIHTNYHLLKNSAFNKNFGTTSGTVAEGNHIHTFDQVFNGGTSLADIDFITQENDPKGVGTLSTSVTEQGTTITITRNDSFYSFNHCWRYRK